MTHEEYLYLTSEIAELEAMLSEIPEDRVIDRMGLDSRLRKARSAISGVNPTELAQKARLTFRGNPVFGSEGIAAEFASKASGCFTEAFTAIVAGLNENLRYMGPIPDKQKNQLIITGTAIGSFGFEYELPARNAGADPTQPEIDFGIPQNTEVAMRKVEELFRIACGGSDDALSELVEELHPRAVKKVSEFLTYIAEQEAWCGLEFDESIFRFSGSDQVRNSAKRLNADNIREASEEYTGHFEGALPTGRTFEFKPRDQKGIIRGKVGPDVEDVNDINREYLYKSATVMLTVIQVGQGRPRYTLAKLESITLEK